MDRGAWWATVLGVAKSQTTEPVSPLVETAASSCVRHSIWTQEGTRGSGLRPSWADPAGNLVSLSGPAGLGF